MPSQCAYVCRCLQLTLGVNIHSSPQDRPELCQTSLSYASGMNYMQQGHWRTCHADTNTVNVISPTLAHIMLRQDTVNITVPAPA